jgi:protein-L-isoaspartate(D-aspartate) O-methyltransferase
MTEALGLCGDERVLEVGTGSGYQAAVLAEIAYRVYSVERLRPLMLRARRLLEGIGYRNVLFRLGDGTAGWAEQAPFDAVIVTAGGPNVPGPLLDQLGPGGRLVAPVGESRSFQNLIRIEKDKNGRLTTRDLGGCRFVDLVGRHGWEDRSVRR